MPGRSPGIPNRRTALAGEMDALYPHGLRQHRRPRRCAQGIERLKKCGMKPAKMFFYVLVREVDDALARIEELDALGCQPFAQPYRDFENKIRPTPEQRRLAAGATINRRFTP